MTFVAGTDTCSSCEFGQYLSSTTSLCTTCQPCPSYSTVVNDCSMTSQRTCQCSAGYSPKNGVAVFDASTDICVACRIGTFAVSAGSSECHPSATCGTGFTVITGTTTTDNQCNCPPGNQATGTPPVCSQCPIFSYNPVTNGVCNKFSVCSDNFVSVTGTGTPTTNIVCSCPAGHYLSASNVCSVCPLNTFQSGSNSTFCSPCGDTCSPCSTTCVTSSTGSTASSSCTCAPAPPTPPSSSSSLPVYAIVLIVIGGIIVLAGIILAIIFLR